MRHRGVLGILALAAALAACGGSGASSGGGSETEAQNVVLTVKAGAGENGGIGSSCGTANFGTSFMNLPGTQITVTNESGTTVGIGDLPTSGKIEKRATPGGPFGVFTEDCVFVVTIPLDGEAKFYKFDFGEEFGWHQVSASDLKANEGAITFDLTGS